MNGLSPRWADRYSLGLWVLVPALSAGVGWAATYHFSRELVAVFLVLSIVAAVPNVAIPYALALLIPFLAFFRRLFLLWSPVQPNMDGLILVPEILVMVLGLKLLTIWIHKRTLARESIVKEEYPILWLALLGTAYLFYPVHWNLIIVANGFRAFTLYVWLFFIVRFIWDWKHVYGFLIILMFTGLIAGCYGLYQTWVGLPEWDAIWAESTTAKWQTINGQLRIFGTLQYASQFSHYMTLSVIGAIGLIHSNRSGLVTRLLSVATVAVCAMGLALSLVRSSWVGLLIALAFLLFRAFSGIKRYMGAALIIGGLLLLGWGSGQEGDPFTTQINSFYSVRETTAVERLDGFILGLRAAATLPTGQGLGITNADRLGQGAFWGGDSQYTTILVELGLPGLALLLWVLVVMLRHGWCMTKYHVDPEIRSLAGTLTALLVAICATSLTGGALLNVNPTNFYFWTGAALLLALPRWNVSI